jgi:toxin ParE1/3/4
MTVVWSPRARHELSEIVDYILAENPVAAVEILTRIQTEVESLRVHPSLGRLGRIVGTRELVIVGTPYIVAYRINSRSRSIDVITVRHGARRWPATLQ